MRTNRSWLVGILSGVVVLSVAGESFAQIPSLVTGSTFTSSWAFVNGANNFLGTGGSGTSTSSGTFATIGSTQTLAFTGTSLVRIDVDSPAPFAVATTDTPTLSVLMSSGASTSMPTMNAVFNRGANTFTYSQTETPAYFIADSNHRFSVTGLTGNVSTASGYPGFWNITGLTGTATYEGLVPEPATLALFGLGLAPIAIAVRRRRK